MNKKLHLVLDFRERKKQQHKMHSGFCVSLSTLVKIYHEGKHHWWCKMSIIALVEKGKRRSRHAQSTATCTYIRGLKLIVCPRFEYTHKQ